VLCLGPSLEVVKLKVVQAQAQDSHHWDTENACE
jgi:hypothetical protein